MLSWRKNKITVKKQTLGKVQRKEVQQKKFYYQKHYGGKSHYYLNTCSCKIFIPDVQKEIGYKKKQQITKEGKKLISLPRLTFELIYTIIYK